MADDGISKDISTQLSNTPYACSSLNKLSGGTANFVYRGVLTRPLQDGTTTVIIKHTRDYIASNPGFKLTLQRAIVEERILKYLNNLPSTVSPRDDTKEKFHGQIQVKTPRLLSSNPQQHTLIMEDLPSAIDLKSFFISASSPNLSIPKEWAMSVGRALGYWLGSFHSWALQDAQIGLVHEMRKNETMRDLKFEINHQNLVGMVDNFPDLLGECRGVFERVRDMAAAEVEGSDKMGAGIGAIHGDFWSGNVLIPSTILEMENSDIPLFITDWELSHCGSYALDLGQMIAELYMLKHFKNIDAGVWVIQGFVEGYPEINENLAYRSLIHVGVHFVFWGATIPGWGSQEQVQDIVGLGRDLVVKAWERERGWFEERVWKCLFKN